MTLLIIMMIKFEYTNLLIVNLLIVFGVNPCMQIIAMTQGRGQNLYPLILSS